MKYLLRRLLHVVPVLLGVTLITFSLLHLIPGDPAQILAGPDASAADVAAMREAMGLNKPLMVQYLDYLTGLFQGDMGRSMSTGRPVLDELMDRFPNTVILAIAGVGVAVLLGVPVGVVAAIRSRTLVDHGSMIFALLGISAPAFWLGFMLMMIFSVQLGWLPSAGYRTPAHLVLPAFTLGTGAMAIVARMTRSSLLEVLRQDYVNTALAKGLREMVVIQTRVTQRHDSHDHGRGSEFRFPARWRGAHRNGICLARPGPPDRVCHRYPGSSGRTGCGPPSGVDVCAG